MTNTFPPPLFAITLFTDDLALSIDFYTRFLGVNPVFGDNVSSVFKVGETLINLLQNASVPELIDPAPMAPAGARAVYSLYVPEISAQAERLRAAGLALLNGPMDRPWGIRTLSVSDPSGHIWELAQRLG